MARSPQSGIRESTVSGVNWKVKKAYVRELVLIPVSGTQGAHGEMEHPANGKGAGHTQVMLVLPSTSGKERKAEGPVLCCQGGADGAIRSRTRVLLGGNVQPPRKGTICNLQAPLINLDRHQEGTDIKGPSPFALHTSTGTTQISTSNEVETNADNTHS